MTGPRRGNATVRDGRVSESMPRSAFTAPMTPVVRFRP
jgi:hypothetical protein